MPLPEEHRWIDHLSPDDLAFLRRFLLASGTLKQLAQEYGVSYPTIRLRLENRCGRLALRCWIASGVNRKTEPSSRILLETRFLVSTATTESDGTSSFSTCTYSPASETAFTTRW